MCVQEQYRVWDVTGEQHLRDVQIYIQATHEVELTNMTIRLHTRIVSGDKQEEFVHSSGSLDILEVAKGVGDPYSDSHLAFGYMPIERGAMLSSYSRRLYRVMKGMGAYPDDEEIRQIAVAALEKESNESAKRS